MRCLSLAVCAALIGFAAPSVAQNLRPSDLDGMAAMAPSKVEAYGADPLQYGELRLPAGPGPFPVAVIIHGGCWTTGFATLRYMAPLASALAAKGVATWNVEYRQLGDNEAGWPGSFLDWAAATDHLRALAQNHPLDLSRVIAVGHSAGAQAALWLAARRRLPPTSAIRGGDPLRISAVVAIDGPVDLKAFIALDKFVCGKPVVSRLLGGSPEQVPGRYRESSPIELLPSGIPSVLVSSTVLPLVTAEKYRDVATAPGDKVEVLPFKDAGHFDMLSSATPSGAAVETAILKAIGLRKP